MCAAHTTMLPVKHRPITKQCALCEREYALVCFPKLRYGHGPVCSRCADTIREGARRARYKNGNKVNLSARSRKAARSRRRMLEA